MVGPMTDEERRVGSRKLYAGFVLTIGFSAGLMAVQGGASPAEAGLVAAIGLGVGTALLWYLRWSTRI